MSIEVKQSVMVCPAEKTPRHSLWLSCLDLVIMIPQTHTRSVAFYRRPSDINSENNSHKFFDVDSLKKSLSRALVTFYPVAGRLKRNNDRIEIDCNGEGVLFIEAEAPKIEVAYFEESGFAPSDEMYELLIPKCDYSQGLSAIPLFMVQLTRFRCGGVAMGFATHHQLGDGAAYLHFITSWSRLTRGLDLEVLPIFDRAPYLSPRTPPQILFHHLEYDPPLSLRSELQLETTTTKACLCKISKEQISALKQKVITSLEEMNGPKNSKLSTFEVLAAHVWRSVCKARGVPYDQDVKIVMPVDGRSRLALPQGYFGNVIFFAACIAKAGDITSKPLASVAVDINKAVRRMNDEYLRSAVDYLESQPDLTAFARGPHSNVWPNISINSWAKLPFDEVDFGWGKPIYSGNGAIRSEGYMYIVESPKRDGGLAIATKFYPHHLTLFQNYMCNF